MKTRLGIVVLASVFAMESAHEALVATNNTFTGSSSIAGWYNVGAVDATIAYSSGAGPRWDYWDGDDGVAQDGATNAQAAAIVAAGGTITGDGLLADGALWFDTTDGTSGNEYIAFTLGGTMEAEEEITFSYNVFNNNDYYSYTQGQLWDMTTGTQLAAAGATPQNANGWTIVKANSDVVYQPQDWFVSYTATAAEEGHELAIVFREWDNSNQRDSYIDNISVTVVPPPPPEGITPLTTTFTGSSSVNGWVNIGTVNATIAYSSGAGPRWDYWDGDNAVMQDGATNAQAAAIVAAGGTITGDGVLADGALWFDVQDGTSGNESIAYTLGGRMVEGEEITFSYNVFNNNDYYSYTQGQLWDMTTGTQLAVAGATPQSANGWTIVQARSAVDYQPQDWFVSYTATAAEQGHKLAIVFREWGSSNHRDPYIDNLEVTSSLDVDTPESLYEDWSLGEGLTSLNSAYAADPDGDGLDNLAEYALGGEPINAADQGIASTYGTMEEGGTNWMTYVYAMRSDYLARGLDYYLEIDTDLVVAPDWTNANYEVVGTHVTGGDFDYVTNRVPTIGEAKQFLRVGIELTP